MSTSIKEPIRRTQAYWYVDGLWEIGFGILFFTLGLELIIEASATDKSAALGFLRAVRYIVLIAGPIHRSMDLLWECHNNFAVRPS